MLFDARVLAFGLSFNRVRWPRSLGHELAAALTHVPVRVYKQGTRLKHPREAAGETDTRGLIGRVETAEATGDAVHARIEIFDQKFAAGLCQLEREHRLTRALGVSLSVDAIIQRTTEMGRAVRLVTSVQSVIALDIVSAPSAGGVILRSLRSAA